MAATRYTVTAERSGEWWVLQAVETPGAITQVADLADASQIIEAIAFVIGMRQATSRSTFNRPSAHPAEPESRTLDPAPSACYFKAARGRPTKHEATAT